MARSKKQCAQAPPAAGQQITKYYTRHIEDKGNTTIENSTDGYTLYRAIARQVIGFPSRFLDIRNAVLQFYLRIYSNTLHPFHNECMRREATIRAGDGGSKNQLFALLDCSDLDPNEHLLWVIAYALKIRIDMYESISQNGEPKALIHSVGPANRPICTVVRRKNVMGTFDKCGQIGMPFRFESLLPDESGKALIEYLQAHREDAAKDLARLQVKQISWAWIQEAGKESWTCFNEYRQGSKDSDLKYNNERDRMDTFVVTVYESRHIAQALKLFREAIKRAPNQRMWVRHSHNNEAGFTIPHCSVDAEFVKMGRDVAEEQGVWARDAVHEGVLEEMCSVLTFAVGRHFFLIFNIVHMLETSDKLTVPALTDLFRETIFNKDLLKLWWNPQSDIAVLDGTIAHMFQQTPRKSCVHTPYGSDHEYVIQPKWRIKRNHFQSTRPDDLKFPTEDIDCELHRWGSNEQGIACCCRLGNIDIAALFTHFCRTHGMDNMVKTLPWTEVRPKFRYDDLLERMLGSDRLYPLLNFMKSRAGKTGKCRDAFYQDMGRPGMELDDDVMAYNIGDVAGQNMIFEQLLASDDKDFVAGCLSAFGHSTFTGSNPRRIPQRPSSFGRVGGIPLWEDNPRSFEDRDFDVDHNNPCWPMLQLYSTQSLTPWEHDRRVRLMRTKAAIVLNANETHYSGAYVLPTDAYRTATFRQKEVLLSLHDRTRMAVSSDCVQRIDATYEDPVVRAGTTHSEALLEYLKSVEVNFSSPPRPFGAGPGSPDGLPAWLKRVPGKGLDQARNLFDAFKQPGSQNGKHLGRPQPVPEMTGWQMQETPDLDVIFNEAWEAQNNNLHIANDKWTMAHYAKFNAQTALQAEKEKTLEEGLPYSLHTRDFFDLEGREYRRRAGGAQAWNRLPFEPKLILASDGTLKSLASMQLEALNDKKRLPNDDGFEEVVRKTKRRYW